MFQFDQEKEDIRRVIQPSYYASFACDGSLCGSLCCRGHWRVVLDDDTLARYQSAGGRLGEELRRGITRTEETGSWVMRHQKGACIFLREDGLCSLHRRFGEVALPDVCAEYPRRTHIYGTRAFRGLCMTCPVAAKAALLPEAPMQFETVQAAFFRPQYCEQEAALLLDEDVFFAVRRIAIAILQERSVSLNHRLAALGLLFSEVETRMEEKREKELAAMGAEFAAEALRAVPALLGDAPLNPYQSLHFFRRLVPYVAAACKDALPETQAVLARVEAAFDGEAMEAFAVRLAQYRSRVLAPYSHMLEHYFVHMFYLERYPLMGGTSLILNYQVFVVLAKLTEFLVLADPRLMEDGTRSADEPAPVQQAILDAARWTSIHTSHVGGFLDALYAYMRDEGLDAYFFETAMFG